MTTREKYLAKPRTDFKRIAYNIARMLGLNDNMIHPKAVREYSTSRQLTYHEVILLVAAALAITAITTLASCSADDTAATTITPNQPIHEPIEVNIGSNLTVTRSTTDGLGETWAGGEKVVLVVGNKVDGSDIPTNPLTEHTYQTVAGTDVALSPVNLANTNFWSSTTEKKKIVSAWSYGTNTAPTLTSNTISSYTLETTQTSGTGELLYSPGASTKAYPNSFSLTFYHQLAKVIFNVKADGPLQSESITGAKMYIPKSGSFTTPDTGAHDATTAGWTFTDTTSPDNVTEITPKTETTTSGFLATYSAVVIPGNYNGKTLLQIATATNGTYKYVPTSLTLNPGMCYTFTISIKNGLMFYENVTVNAWTTGTTYPVAL